MNQRTVSNRDGDLPADAPWHPCIRGLRAHLLSRSASRSTRRTISRVRLQDGEGTGRAVSSSAALAGCAGRLPIGTTR